MRTVGDLIDAVEGIDMNYLIAESLYQSGDDFVRLQREQMLRGEREDGQPIFNVKTGSDQYSKSYAKRKGKSAPIDLYDTGAFQSDIFLQINDPAVFIVDSGDSKSGKLQENYGREIFGLNDNSQVEFIPIAQENLYNDLVAALSA